jgi:hypothetical protein
MLGANLTEAQRALVKQAATLTIQSEKLQPAMISGQAVDIDHQLRVADALARTFAHLGVGRGLEPAAPEQGDRS